MWMQYGHSFAQSNAAIKFPVFRQVSYPYLPGISSDYFFFSGDGLMWFSTAQGLTSFDGSGVIFHSNVAETNEYGLSNILRIAEDANHNLYIGSILGFVFFNRNTRQFLTLEYTPRNTGKVRPINAFSFFIDKDGTVFAGTLNQGLVVYHPRTKKMEHYNLSPAKPDDWEDWSENTVTSFSE